MMSQQDFNHNLLGALDAMHQIIWNKQLLDLAIENTATFNEKSFDRISVLLESFDMLFVCHLEELQSHLEWLQAYNHTLHVGSCASSSTSLQVTTTVCTSTSTYQKTE